MNDERDERELSVNDSDDPCESDARASGDTQEPDAAAPQTVYEWDYRRQLREDEQEARKGRRSGVVTFAVVMSVCFVLTLGVLIAALALGGFDAPNGQGGTIQTGDADGQALSLQQISERGKEVVVAISVRTATQRGTGTGIVMTSNGYIATNAHVVANAQQITVKLYNGRTYDATLIGMSEIDDLAVIQINAYGLKTATFGDSDAAVEGDRAVVIGHPAGLEFGWTSTYGYISGINRDVKIHNPDGTLEKKMTLIQTDANVNSGNSGGPMFNDRGEVIGIITMKLTGDFEGMGFAIPSNAAIPLLEALMERGTTDGVQSEVSSVRPVLGIVGVTVEKDRYYVMGESRIYTLTEEQAANTQGSFYVSVSGVLITSVSANSKANGVLQEGDIIVAVDDVAVATMNELMAYLDDRSVGDTVKLEFVRDGQTLSGDVTLIAAQ